MLDGMWGSGSQSTDPHATCPNIVAESLAVQIPNHLGIVRSPISEEGDEYEHHQRPDDAYDDASAETDKLPDHDGSPQLLVTAVIST